MSATILDGRKIKDEAIPLLKKRVSALSFVPSLAIVQVGDREDTNAYIKAKKAFAEKIGVEVRHIQFKEKIDEAGLIQEIEKLNKDSKVHGIIVQLPLPEVIDRDRVINAISPEKDTDALTADNVKRWINGSKGAILPATARGIRTLLKYYNIGLSGKKVAVVGRSALVGKPTACMCLNENATVTISHSQTLDLARETQGADIIIVATGKPCLITAKHVREGQVVVDVGINTVDGNKLDDEIVERKLVGDVDFENVSKIVSAISPVPGGVGPLTVLSLFENLLEMLPKSI